MDRFYERSVEEKIMQLLGRQPGLSANELHAYLLLRKHPCTLQAIYKELGKLESQGAIAKIGKSYRLSLGWASDFLSLGDAIRANYLNRPLLDQLLPRTKKRARWKFTNLFRLKNLWTQFVLALSQSSESGVLLSWNPHPLFYLSEQFHEPQTLNVMKRHGMKMLKIVGGRTALDHSSARFWEKPHVEYSFAESPFERERGRYYSVVDDYIIRVDLPDKISHAVDELYELTNAEDASAVSSFLNTIATRCPAELVIERHSARSRNLTRQFESYFGVQI